MSCLNFVITAYPGLRYKNLYSLHRDRNAIQTQNTNTTQTQKYIGLNTVNMIDMQRHIWN